MTPPEAARRPHAPASEEALDALLSTPSGVVVDTLRRVPGDVIVLGAGGKMGPTLARMVRRAADDAGLPRRVLAVSRFGDAAAVGRLEAAGVEAVRCDLTDRAAVDRLPDAPNVIFMAGQKFGTMDAPSTTWMTNVVVPAFAAQRYAGARMVAFSTGNVYPFTPVAGGGARETDALGPVGEYANSCVGRERVLAFHAARDGTRVALVRLNYAIDLRYGVLVDLARRVLAGEPIDLRTGYVNVIWQGDANAWAIRCLEHAAAPPFVVNVTGRETLAVRALAEALGERLGRRPVFAGVEAPDALLSDASLAHRLFGEPTVDVDTMLDWTAAWLRHGGALLDKPTHFEARDGRF